SDTDMKTLMGPGARPGGGQWVDESSLLRSKPLNEAPCAPAAAPASRGVVAPLRLSLAWALLMSQFRLVGESALASASSRLMTFSRYMRYRSCSKVCEPGDRLCSIASLISLRLPASI